MEKGKLRGTGQGQQRRGSPERSQESGSNEQNVENPGTETELGGWGGLLFRKC